MSKQLYALHSVESKRVLFESKDGSHNTAAAYEFTKGDFIRNTLIDDKQAEDFNLQSHNSYARYYVVDEAEKAAQEAAKPKGKRGK